MDILRSAGRRGFALFAALALCLSLLPPAAWAANTTESETQGTGKYSMTCTIVYHSNYPNGTDVQKTVNYTINATYNIANTGMAVRLKSLTDLGFVAPSGYTFKVWNDVKDGNGGNPVADTYFCYNNGTVHLYAQYNSNAPTTYTVSFDANGGSGTMTAVSVVSGSYTLPNCTFTAPPDKRFKGWSNAANGTVISGSTITVSKNTTLYAIWEDIPAATYTVSFHPNGGTGTMKAVTVASGSYTLPTTCSFTAPTGQRFKGWATAADGAVLSGTTITVSGDTTLYAIWEDIPTTQFSLTYMDRSTVYSTKKYSEGASVTVDGCNADNSGYVFKGWDTTSAAATVVYTAGSSFIIRENTMLFAVWEKVPTYAISFNANGGTGTMNTVTGISGSYTLPTTCSFNAPAGKQFKGWSTAANGTVISSTAITVNADITLYAIWEDSPVTKFTLTYMDRGSQYASEKHDQGASVTAADCTNTNPGYAFKGWDTSSAAAKVVYAPGASITVNADTTLYAVWERDDTSGTESEVQGSGTYSMECTIVYHSNYPSGADDQKTVHYTIYADHNLSNTGKNVSVKSFSALGFTVPQGYTMQSDLWRAQGNGRDEPIRSTIYMTNNETVHLYAQYAAKPSSSGGSSGGSSGSYTPPTYSVTAPSGGTSSGGRVSVDTGSARPGSTVTIAVTPEEGYEVKQITVTDRNGKTVTVTDQGDGTYTFTMPSGQVAVDAQFQPAAPVWSNTFADIDAGAGYYEAVQFVCETGLMNGNGDGTFAPDKNLSRAMLAQILYNKEGRPDTAAASFTDVASDAWYAPAVAWASANGISSGYGGGQFGPNAFITREQFAVMLWRYAGSPAATDKELHFADADQASAWAEEALAWAVKNGILSGRDGGSLDPGGYATRAEAAQMLKNFLEEES